MPITKLFMSRRFLFSIIQLLILAFFVPLSNVQTYRVKRVIDTLLLTNGERVRLIGVDTPETHEEAVRRFCEKSVSTEYNVSIEDI